MAYSEEERGRILRSCTRSLGHHYPRSVAERARAIAESPLAQTWQDGYGRGGFLQQFEREIADLLGKEDAVFMPSGTMAQQIALRIWCDAASCRRIAFHPTCHLEIHEHKAYAELHGMEAELVGDMDALIFLEDLEAISEPIAALLLELPQREIGGQLPSWEDLQAQSDWAQARRIRLHLDGARLWECSPFYGRSYREICGPFDSVYVSFYKILGGLPGAVLAGPTEFISEARIWQRRHGGNLQQQSISAIAAKLGLDTHLPRVGEYWAKAKEFAAAFTEVEGVTVVPQRPPTNMMHLHITGCREALETAALEVMDETGLRILEHLHSTKSPDHWKWELTVGNAGLDVPVEEATTLLRRVLPRGRS